MIKKIILIFILFFSFLSVSNAFSGTTFNTDKSKLLNWTPVLEFDDIYLKENLGQYSFLENENFTWAINWTALLTWSWYTENIDFNLNLSNPQDKQLITLLYDIRLILFLILILYSFNFIYKFLRSFLYIFK